MKRRPAWWVYLVGIVLLGAAYPILKASLEPWVFVAVGIVYLVGLRVAGEVIERRLRARSESGGHET